MIFMACDGIWEGLYDQGENLTSKIFKNNKELCNFIIKLFS